MKRITFFVFSFLFFTLNRPVYAATPTVTNFTPSSTSIGQYKKFEATFQISKSFASDSFLPYYYYDPTDTPTADPGRSSPYGVDGISIDAHFTSPSGKQLIVPAFYYQDYTINGSTTTPGTTYSWKIRFAPEEIGNYTYYLVVQDKEGTIQYPTSGNLSFTVTSSTSHGFIRVSSKDPRFMAFSDGTSFIPLGSGHQWWKVSSGRSADYVNAFNSFGQSGINLTRIWDQNDGYNLTTEGHFDAYTYPGDFTPSDNSVIAALPKGTQINQRGAAEQDIIFNSAENNGVYIELCSHGDAYWIWDGATYNESWNTSIQNFSSVRHINYWKRNFRYRVARFGYSTSILSWENWNELGHIVSGSDQWNFYQTYGTYQTNTDPYHHLRTTSQGSQSYSPGFWSSGAMDLANYHDYMMSNRYPSLYSDEANFVYRFAWCLGTKGAYCSGLGLGDGSSWSGAYKPWIWGEFDAGTTNWNEANSKAMTVDGRIRVLHNSTWAGLFSPMGTSPLDWYWDQEGSDVTTARYADRKATSAYFKNMDYDGANFTYFMSSSDAPPDYSSETIPVSNNTARAYGMRRADKKAAYYWVQNRNYIWNNSGNTPAAISTTVTVNNLLNETYKLEIWDTHSGTIISTSTQTPSNGNLTVSISGLSTDTAIKIESTNTPPTSSTPIPTSTPKVGILDLRQLLGIFINVFDYNRLVKNFGK